MLCKKGTKVSFDLKKFRETIYKDISQEKFSELVGLSQSTVSRVESGQATLSIDDLIKIATKTGSSLDDLVHFEETVYEAMEVKNGWEKMHLLKNALRKYISEEKSNFTNSDIIVETRNAESIFFDASRAVEKAFRKPKVAVIGKSDSGKSTLINCLLGQKDILPHRWAPCTSIIAYIKHVKDRPEFINEEVWYFQNDDNDSVWDDTRLYDEKYCASCKIGSGPYESLATFGTRNGRKYEENNEQCTSCVLFVDAPLLLNCDFVDVPGLTGEVETRGDDNSKAREAMNFADIMIYMSPSIGFLNDLNEFTMLAEAIDILPPVEEVNGIMKPLSNLFVVASHAHTVGKDAGNIASTKADNFYEQQGRFVLERRKEKTGVDYDESMLKSRFFCFATDRQYYREEFENALRETISEMPDFLMKKAIDNMHKIATEEKKYFDAQMEDAIHLKDNYQNTIDFLDKIKASEDKRKKMDADARSIIYSKISACRKASIEKFEQKYYYILSDDHISNLIKNYGKNKKGMEALANRVSSELSSEFKKILNEKSKELSDDINGYLKTYQAYCDQTFVTNSPKVSGFSAERAFASGLAGLATFGGLAAWAASFGNLGGYILVAKGVSLLSTLGISVGGVSSAVGAVAAMGGPITLGVALAAIATISAFAVLTGTSNKIIAKRVRDAYDKEHALDKYADAFSRFWKETKDAFDKAANSMNEELERIIKERENMVKDFDCEKFEKYIQACREIGKFFSGIPQIIDESLSKDGV